MTAIEKITSRRNIVAGTYASLMQWAKTVYDIPAETSEDINDFYALPRGTYELAVGAGLSVIVAECKGLDTAIAALS
jgi:hypothetical protein